MNLNTVKTVTVAEADKALAALEAGYQTEKAKIVAVVQAHIDAHKAAEAQHAAERAAAAAVLAKANPGAAQVSTQAAAFILTAPSGVQRVAQFVANNWRTLFVVALVGSLVAAYAHGMIRV